MAKVGYVMNYAGYRANTDKEWMKRLELGKYGVEVVGVVCLAKTVKYPEKIEIWIESHFK